MLASCPRPVAGTNELTSEWLPYLRLIALPSAPSYPRPDEAAHTLPQLTQEQWECVAQCNTYGGVEVRAPAPPRAAAPPPSVPRQHAAAGSGSHAANTAAASLAAASLMDDDIEED